MKRSLLLSVCVCAVAGAQTPIWQGRDAGPSVPSHARLVDRVRAASTEASSNAVFHWNEALLMSIKAENTPPPLGARQLAIMHIALFDAANAVRRGYEHFEVDVKPEADTSEEAAAAAAAHRVLSRFYPGRVAKFDALLERSLESPGNPSSISRGAALGRYVANEILNWRSRDGSTREVIHPKAAKPGDWKPTPPKFAEPLAPHWPKVTCFAIRRGFEFRPDGPPALNSKAYTESFEEVKALGGKNSAKRTADQTEIAWFWACGEGTVTPPGHWNRITQRIARNERYSLIETARLFALVNTALADAGIACWDCKYHTNFWRPYHGIREADTDGNPDTLPDRDWEPLLVTPPFPSYTSGHSTFSGAAATILAGVVGRDNYEFESTSEAIPDAVRKYSGFWAAAEEAGMSRIYGGIHWQFDNTEGLTCGKQIAKRVLEKCLKPIQR